MQGMIDGLEEAYREDRERILRSLRLAFITPSLKPRLFAQQVGVADLVATILAKRQPRDTGDIEVRSLAAPIGSALFVAIEAWQASDGRQDLGKLIRRALGSVVVSEQTSRSRTPAQRTARSGDTRSVRPDSQLPGGRPGGGNRPQDRRPLRGAAQRGLRPLPAGSAVKAHRLLRRQGRGVGGPLQRQVRADVAFDWLVGMVWGKRSRVNSIPRPRGTRGVNLSGDRGGRFPFIEARHREFGP